MTSPAPSPSAHLGQLANAIPSHAYFVISAVFHYMGPAFAVLLFRHVEVLGVAWLRIASAALVFAIWRRPWRFIFLLDPRQLRLLFALGLVLGSMNATFYLAINRLPLGTVGAIEFLGPIALAAYGARTRRNLGALTVATIGVYLLTDVRIAGEPLGFLFAFLNCAFFVLYVIFGHRIAQDGGTSGIDRLGASMLIALIVVSPLGFKEASVAFFDPGLLAAGIAVGVCSSVIPYVCDQLAMVRLTRATFALLLSLLPATAAIIGLTVLKQTPSMVEIAGIVLVILGVAIHQAPVLTTT